MALTIDQDFAVDRPRKDRGFLRRVAEGMIASRQRQADRMVASYLLALDDETLAKLGYQRADVARRYMPAVATR